MCNILVVSVVVVHPGTEKFPKSFPEVSKNIRDTYAIKVYNTCLQSVNILFIIKILYYFP